MKKRQTKNRITQNRTLVSNKIIKKQEDSDEVQAVDVVRVRKKKKKKKEINATLRARINKTQLALEFAENIVDNIRVSLLILDADLKVVSASRFFYQTFHLEQENVIGEYVFNLCNGEWNIAELIILLKNILSKNTVVEDYEAEFVSEKTGLRKMLFNANELIQHEGKERLILLSTQDITERRHAEEKLHILNTELEEKAGELQQILYVTTHDLRSPLVNIQGFSKELHTSLRELGNVLNHLDVPPENKGSIKSIMEGEIPEALHFINSSTKKMDDLLSGLLMLSRLGRQRLNLTDLDMNKLMQDVLDNYTYKIGRNRIEIKIEILPSCKGDSIQVYQLFSNLIGNSIKFMEVTRTGKISISGIKNGDYSKYIIEDNGIGIHKDYQDKIFELFHKLDPRKPGIGLGMNIVKQVVEKHNGRIELKSEEGKGTIICVELPST